MLPKVEQECIEAKKFKKSNNMLMKIFAEGISLIHLKLMMIMNQNRIMNQIMDQLQKL